MPGDDLRRNPYCFKFLGIEVVIILQTSKLVIAYVLWSDGKQMQMAMRYSHCCSPCSSELEGDTVLKV